MSMRVERSTLDQVKKRFEVNKKKMEEKQKDYDFEERMKELREEVGSLPHSTPIPRGELYLLNFCTLRGTFIALVWDSHNLKEMALNLSFFSGLSGPYFFFFFLL